MLSVTEEEEDVDEDLRSLEDHSEENSKGEDQLEMMICSGLWSLESINKQMFSVVFGWLSF